jgi:Cu/Ag efflux protein CusF
VREVMANRFKDMKLTGDPDRDFAAMLIAQHEDLIFLAKTQLEYGGDRQLRQTAQKILDEKQREIDELKQWQVRSHQADYKAQPDQPPPGSGPLEQKASGQSAQAQPTPAPPSTPAQSAPSAPPSAQNLPMVSGTVEKIDAAAGKITIEHGAIPNLNMDSMTMVFRAQNPAMLKGLKQGDKIRFTADRVNGQMTVTKIQKAR